MSSVAMERQPAVTRGKARYSYFPLYRLRQLLWSVVRTILVMGICFVILYPLIVKFSVSIMDEMDLYDMTVRYVPKHFTLKNYETVWEYMRYPEAFMNSLRLSLLTSIMQLISCTLIGYGFARFNFPLKNLLFGLVIAILVVPPQTIMIPLFLRFRFFDVFGIISALRGETLNLLSTYWPFVFMSATGMGLKNGLYIYMMRQHFRGAPKDLEEAAYIDGAGPFKTFYRIMLPGAIPMMVTVFLFSFVWQWTDTFYSSLFLQKLWVLPTALSSLVPNVSKSYSAEQLGMMVYLSPAYASMLNNTGSILVVIPLAVIYIFAQRYFVESIERSGLTGM
nr:MAG: carbohydrate ABC transporter permease [Caldicoprobacter oshimai]